MPHQYKIEIDFPNNEKVEIDWHDDDNIEWIVNTLTVSVGAGHDRITLFQRLVEFARKYNALRIECTHHP